MYKRWLHVKDDVEKVVTIIEKQSEKIRESSGDQIRERESSSRRVEEAWEASHLRV